MDGYQKPMILDYGELKDLTASSGTSRTIDVPKGTVIPPGVSPFS